MKLSQLVNEIEYLHLKNFIDLEVSGLCVNSNGIFKGDLFICINGYKYDSHEYISKISKKCVAVVTERELDAKIPQIIVKDSRLTMEKLAKTFYDKPDEKLKIIGITGTNGKTTTTYMIKSILEQSGKKVGIIGTLGILYDNVEIEPILTTPDPIYMYKTLNDMVNKGIEYVVIEVSAHAIYLQKVNSMKFEVCIFSNCTHDHLDFFKNMEEYRKVKKSFFENFHYKIAILNFDDDLGLDISKVSKDVVSYGLNNPSDIFAVDIRESLESTFFVVNSFDNIYEINLKLLGLHNVYNCLSAIACATCFNLDVEDIIKGLAKLEVVNGRLERVAKYKNAYIFVDYAHTPDGLEKSLKCLKTHTKGKLISLFGCGGNRDKDKRGEMGKISGKYADFTIITTDNPRYEDANEIIGQIEKGITEISDNYIAITDREEGILYGIKMLKDGDILLVSGKGGEKYQEIYGIKHIYSDKNTILKIINLEKG